MTERSNTPASGGVLTPAQKAAATRAARRGLTPATAPAAERRQDGAELLLTVTEGTGANGRELILGLASADPSKLTEGDRVALSLCWTAWISQTDGSLMGGDVALLSGARLEADAVAAILPLMRRLDFAVAEARHDSTRPLVETVAALAKALGVTGGRIEIGGKAETTAAGFDLLLAVNAAVERFAQAKARPAAKAA